MIGEALLALWMLAPTDDHLPVLPPDAPVAAYRRAAALTQMHLFRDRWRLARLGAPAVVGGAAAAAGWMK
jgi:hypothetical protein